VQQHQRRQSASWRPPLPSQNDWQGMCWYLHYHRHHLRKGQAELVVDLLLGQGEAFDDGRIRDWVVMELRQLVARLRVAAA
jgi:hypothetical protein